jgi:hypothetical protein
MDTAQGVMATFMLHGLSPDVAILFSIRQDDPVAMILYVIQTEPLLFRLGRVLHDLRVGPVLETALGYVDDVAMLGDTDQDLVVLDEIMAAFERASGAILNRNRTSVIVGRGTWESREDWPIPWLRDPRGQALRSDCDGLSQENNGQDLGQGCGRSGASPSALGHKRPPHPQHEG